MSKPKYFGIHCGPPYLSYGYERVMGFSSLAEARDTFRDFRNNRVWYDEYHLNADGYYVPWSIGNYSFTPGTSHEDRMELYVAVPGDTPGTYVKSGEIAYRMTFGERNGIVVE